MDHDMVYQEGNVFQVFSPSPYLPPFPFRNGAFSQPEKNQVEGRFSLASIEEEKR
jgi:hypothetical protein